MRAHKWLGLAVCVSVCFVHCGGEDSLMGEIEQVARWIRASAVQTEHRSRPDFLQAQTNLMQGAAGIGLWLFHLEEYKRGQKPCLVLPDNPFQ